LYILPDFGKNLSKNSVFRAVFVRKKVLFPARYDFGKAACGNAEKSDDPILLLRL